MLSHPAPGTSVALNKTCIQKQLKEGAYDGAYCEAQ